MTFALCHGPYTCSPSYPIQAPAWEIVALHWGFHWADPVDSLMWCGFHPYSNPTQNLLLSGNNLSLFSPFQKLGQGEKCNIITKAKLPFHAIQYPHIHRCISHTLLININNNNSNNNNNVQVSWSHWAENGVVSMAVNCVLCGSSFKQSQVQHGKKNKKKNQKRQCFKTVYTEGISELVFHHPWAQRQKSICSSQYQNNFLINLEMCQ